MQEIPFHLMCATEAVEKSLAGNSRDFHTSPLQCMASKLVLQLRWSPLLIVELRYVNLNFVFVLSSVQAFT